MLFSFLSDFLQKKHLDCFAPIPLGDCVIQKPYLLEREKISDGTALMIAVPYYTHACDSPSRNLSAYAVCENYHLFFDELFGELIPLLQKKFPQYRFAGFADHSPISELPAAAKAGLGIIGKNGLLITEKYSSYIFLGELVTDAVIPAKVKEIRSCEDCGACKSACPMEKIGTCLSTLTQTKKDLTEEEKGQILAYSSAWGCDICQEVCPHTEKAMQSGSIYSPVPFFAKTPIAHLTASCVNRMSEEEFCRRAYSWRGREPILRNLSLFEEQEKKDS